MGKNGMVTSGHHLASFVGAHVLREGGNAVDASIATSATLCVVKPHMCGLGGDSFTLVYHQKTGHVNALNASGPAPKRSNAESFLEEGFTGIPEEGIRSAAVPGIVDSWTQLSEKYGTLPLAKLLEPAVNYAIQGFPVYGELSKAIEIASEKISASKESARTYISNGSAPKIGDILVQSDLGDSLKKLAHLGREAYYEGEIADAIDNYSSEKDGWLTKEDLHDYKSEWFQPISTEYRGSIVYEQPPVSQGFLLLEMLNIVEGYDLAAQEFDSIENIHLCSEAAKLAFADRLKYFGDPQYVNVPIERILSKEHAHAIRNRIKMDEVNKFRSPRDLLRSYQTTYSAVIDDEGNAVSCIISLFTNFGSGVIVPKTGIVLNDRMFGFSLRPGHPNRLEPGKRPIHTLNSYMILKNGDLFLFGGSPGADLQVQTNLQVISNIIDHKMDLQTAIEAPRWSIYPGSFPLDEENHYELRLESRFAKSNVDDLAEVGHKVRIAGPWEFGDAAAIKVDGEKNCYFGGADLRRESYAIGF